MPIHITDEFGVPTLQDQVNWGSKAIAEIYWGSQLKYKNQQNYNMNSATNVNIATFLVGEGASVNSPVIITIAIGEIIGSTDVLLPALVTGDLSIYTRGVTLIVNGEIQGAGGDMSAGGSAFVATSDITITNNGAIRAGGGAGAVGGNGGAGNDILTPWSNWRYDEGSDRFCTRHPDDNDITGDESEWNNVDLTTNNRPEPNTQFIIFSAKVNGPHTYERGTFQEVTNGSKKHQIRRASEYPTSGQIGFGGQGGLGEGYTQTKTNGAVGTNGTNRAGNGGNGGNGGNWGESGGNGDVGQAGLFYDITGPNNINVGGPGGSGYASGNAIESGGNTVVVTGPGVINGPVT